MSVKLTETDKRLLQVLQEMQRRRVYRSQQNIIERMGWRGLRGVSKLFRCMDRLQKFGLVAPVMGLALVSGPGLSSAGRLALRKAA